MIRHSWVVLGKLVVFAVSAYSGEKLQAPSEKAIKALIEQLVSPNRKPITVDEDKSVKPGYRLPQGFSGEKQRQVDRAYDKLTELGPQAFPFLIERWGDNRYCRTRANCLSECCHNESVGEVCHSIIFDQLQPYGHWPRVDDPDPRGKPSRPDYPSKFLGSPKAAREWWKKNKGKTLYQMQCDVLDWVIAEEAKQPRDFSAEEKRELQRIREKLKKSGKPLPTGNYDGTRPLVPDDAVAK